MSEFSISTEWHFDRADKQITNACLKGLLQGGIVAAGEASKDCPRDTGTLARSICATQGGLPDMEQVYEQAKNGEVNTENKQGDEIAVYISANTPYAHNQHENHAEKAKFIERGLQNVSDKIPKLVQKEINKL